MRPASLLASLVGLVTTLLAHPPRDRRGLSQSTENAILLVGAVAIAGIVIAVLTTFVQTELANL